jgi:hypothetical protein
MVLGPGESTTVQSSAFTMTPGMGGPHLFRVYLQTNDPAQPVKTVDVFSDWVP